ncbi:MAG: hypothetical protein OER97_07390 [Gammaproteobacteria bacterium]|nr:hypothetical protein [Gammaproteobacteria bacterium]
MQMQRIFSATILAGIVYSSTCIATAEDERYRVSGIIMTPEKQIAVVEKSDGSQELYRQGDAIDGFVVEFIDSDGIHLKRGASQIFLELEGTPTRLEDVAAASRTRDLQISAGNASQSIDYDKAQLELEALSREHANSESAGSDDNSAEEKRAMLEERLNIALELPSHTVIKAIGRDTVQRPEHAMMLLTHKVARGESVRLEVGGSIPGVEVLYLTPNATPSDGASSP